MMEACSSVLESFRNFFYVLRWCKLIAQLVILTDSANHNNARLRNVDSKYTTMIQHSLIGLFPSLISDTCI